MNQEFKNNKISIRIDAPTFVLPFDQSGKEEIDLSEGDWAEYDEEAEEAVGIYEFKS